VDARLSDFVHMLAARKDAIPPWAHHRKVYVRVVFRDCQTKLAVEHVMDEAKDDSTVLLQLVSQRLGLP
jgi:hypothetical protein